MYARPSCSTTTREAGFCSRSEPVDRYSGAVSSNPAARLPASRGPRLGFSGCDRVFGELNRQAAALAQGVIVGGRDRCTVPLLLYVVATASAGLERRSGIPEQRWNTGRTVLPNPAKPVIWRTHVRPARVQIIQASRHLRRRLPSRRRRAGHFAARVAACRSGTAPCAGDSGCDSGSRQPWPHPPLPPPDWPRSP